jgi:hypothetical protein
LFLKTYFPLIKIPFKISATHTPGKTSVVFQKTFPQSRLKISISLLFFLKLSQKIGKTCLFLFTTRRKNVKTCLSFFNTRRKNGKACLFLFRTWQRNGMFFTVIFGKKLFRRYLIPWAIASLGVRSNYKGSRSRNGKII